MSEVLTAPLDISFDYTRSLGQTLSRFMTGLRDRRILGGRGADGRVHVPPPEYDPVTSEPVTELVEVADTGTVRSWSWNAEPLEGQPLDQPFAWALVQLDGADTSMLHALDVGSADEVRTGMRVQVRWATETAGHIRDIACFVPEGQA
ncbi:MAG TPA: OB-fold domain-containing protein [Nocardioidaceae bacterium]|nr:OB-fold domain-containing protein [Nocardioidaceae bacterium]